MEGKNVKIQVGIHRLVQPLQILCSHEAHWVEGERFRWDGQLLIVAVLQTFQLQQHKTHLQAQVRQSSHSFTASPDLILRTPVKYLMPVW